MALDEIAFGGQIVKVPDGQNHFDGQVTFDGWGWSETDGWHRYDGDGVPVAPLVVDVEAGIDIDTGIVRWSLICADENTGYFPDDPNVGFLPPNQEAVFYPDPDNPDRMIHPGEGYVSFKVRPVAEAATGTEITNAATIIFDWNASLVTDPAAFNTIDAGAPSSEILPLFTDTYTEDFDVCWAGEDDVGENGEPGSGIESYTIYVSDDGESYSLWVTTEDTCGTFTGAENGHVYRFYSVARDHVGHIEEPPTDPGTGEITPDAETTIVIHGPECEPGGPYVADCAGPVTEIPLDGSGSSDEFGHGLTFAWTSDCPGAGFDDPTSPMPTLRVDTSAGCSMTCNVTLAVNDGFSTETCSAPVTINDIPNPLLLAAGSRMTHGDAGVFEIDLLLDVASPAVEHRRGGPTRIVLRISKDIQATDGTLDCTEIALTGATCVDDDVSLAGNEITIDLTGTPPNSCLSVALSGIEAVDTGEPLTGDNDVHVLVNPGNVNGDDTVDVLD